MIHLITDVNEDTNTLQDIAQHNILYGLLHERPGLWSGFNFEQEEKEEPKVEKQDLKGGCDEEPGLVTIIDS